MRRRMSRSFGRARRSRRSSGTSGIVEMAVMGAAYGGLIRPIVSNNVPNFFTFGPVDSDNAILLAGGYFAHKNSNKWIKALGNAAIIWESGIIASRLMQGSGSNGGSVMNANNY